MHQKILIDALDEGTQRYHDALEKWLSGCDVNDNNIEQFLLETRQTVEPLTTRYVLKRGDQVVSSLLISYTLDPDDD